jgi:large subunit ribosomal protein L31
MKKDIHPDNYRLVIFRDTSNDEQYLIGSVIETDQTGKWEDGKEYPLVNVEVSSASHPFYTGGEKVIKARGRVERFQRRAASAASDKKK